MGSDSVYTSMNYQERNPAADEIEYATLKEVKGPQHSVQRQERAPRTQSESDAVGMESDPDYAVPYQHRKGHKDDNSLVRGLQETPGDNTPRENFPPNIPVRPDLQEHTGVTSDAAESRLSSSAPTNSPFATTPRKVGKRPVPTPRRSTNSRPVSDAGSFDTKAVSGKESLPANGHFQARCNSETVISSGTGGVVGASTDNKVSPPIPLPYQPTKASLNQQELAEYTPVHSEMHLKEQSADDKEFQEELEDRTTAPEQPLKKKHYIIIAPPIPNGEGTAHATASQDPHDQDLWSESQTPAVDKDTGATSNSDSSFQLTEDRLYVNADEVRSLPDDLVDLSLEPEAEPIYDKPIQLPEPPDIPNEVLNQRPPSPRKLFGGSMRGDPDTSVQLPLGGLVNNTAFHLLDQVPQRANPPEEPVNPVEQLVHPSDQPVNPGGDTSEGAYGEEIDAGIREIREICGEEVQRDWCYAALLQFQGDVSQVVRVIKIQKLSKVTGKTEQFCERTLCHCSWDLDRAASYIFENFQDKDV